MSDFNLSALSKEELRTFLLSASPLFTVKGVIGPYVVRYYKGRPVISRRSTNYRTPQTVGTISCRNNFASVVQFAKFLNGIEQIKEIWKKATVDGRTSYSKLLKHNIKNFRNSYPTMNNIITPGDGHFNIDELISFKKDLRIKVNKGIENATLVLVIIAFDPLVTGSKPFEMLNVCSSTLYPGMEFELNDDQIKVCKRYKKYVMYAAVIKKHGENIQWSNTYATEGEMEWNHSDFSEKQESPLFILLIYHRVGELPVPLIINANYYWRVIHSILLIYGFG